MIWSPARPSRALRVLRIRCAFYDLTRPDVAGVRHVGQIPLTAAVAGAVQRPLADAWTWNRRGSTVTVTPLVACSLALWGHSRAPGLQLFVVNDTTPQP